jgi:hypothetical protein
MHPGFDLRQIGEHARPQPRQRSQPVLGLLIVPCRGVAAGPPRPAILLGPRSR